ncbi:MAG: ribbon-helix-helix protein, CopG family [Oscillatoriophycideae cyanobacterium NC_groundwater_1537_Pr4_S-0.65um_50_18]|nr:ribbon-helix-helix protein, CopG family [Oscillatoriophycideae cyanobacterium NC_groundwater_1537_Pr4_S-0.65um_50_18]
MTTKKRQTSIYLPDDLRENLEAIAEKEQRSLTFVIEQLLREALQVRQGSAGK